MAEATEPVLVLMIYLMGIFAGGFASIDSDHFWDFASSIAGGVIGALAGGVPAYLLAVKATKDNLIKEKSIQVDNDLAILQSAFIKLAEITNGIYTLATQINDALHESHVRGHKEMALWQRMLGLVGFEDGPPIRFDSKEIALFMRDAENAEYANLLLLIDKRYSALMSSIEAYSIRREELLSMLKPEKFVDGIGQTTLTEEQLASVNPRAYNLEKMAESILTLVHEDRRLSMRLTQEFGPRAKRMYPGRRVPAFGLAPMPRA